MILTTKRLTVPFRFETEIIEKILTSVTASLITEKIKNLLFKRTKTNVVEKLEFDEEKNYMLLNICRLYEIPKFTIDNATMNKSLIDILYQLSIELILKFEVEDKSRMRYISRNYSIDTDDRYILIDALEKEMRKPERHDARYRMGFRSVFVLISDNIDKIDKSYLKDILLRLRPFFDVYEHKELLNFHSGQ